MSKGKWAVVLAVVVLLIALAAPAVPATLQVVARHDGSGPWFQDMTPDGSLLLLSGVLWHRVGALTEPLGVPSGAAALSADGRYLAFTSAAPDLVPDDPNGAGEDFFFRDLATGATERIAPANSETTHGGTSVRVRDGARLVFFTSWASDVVPDDTNGDLDVFVYDRQAASIERVNVGYLDQEVRATWPPRDFGVSADGRYVVFVSDATDLVPGGTNGRFQAFLRDRAAQTTSLVSLNSLGGMASGDVWDVAISGDGRTVAFATSASSFLPGTSTVRQVYMRDLVTGSTECVSMTPDGHPGDDESWRPILSDDGRYVAFRTEASNFAIDDDKGGDDVYVKDRATGSLIWASRATTGEPVNYSWCQNSAISADGRFVAMEVYPLDWGSLPHGILLWDRDGLYDVPPDYWAFPEVVRCFYAGVVSGYPDGAYHPDWPVSRDQMAVYIARALVSPSGDAAIPDPTPPPSFSDVPPTQWAYKQIEYAVSQNVVKGYEGGTYGPDIKLDRGQMAVFVARAMVAPGGDAAVPDPTPPATFADVPSDFWSYRHVEYCVSQGVVTGYEDGNYHPERIVTRDQMAVYIARAFGLL